MGWPYLGIGVVFPIVLALPLLYAGKTPEVAAFTKLFPLQLPMFAVLGSMGGLMTFVSDRTKGVFEYLLAYRVRPRNLFVNGLLATAVMSSVTVGASLLVVLGAASARGVPMTEDLGKSIALYTVPMGFASAFFAATVGMVWSSLSNPRTGFNSPVGIAPILGILPGIFVLITVEALPSSEYYYVTVGAAVVIIAAVVALLSMSSRYLGRERFLSPL